MTNSEKNNSDVQIILDGSIHIRKSTLNSATTTFIKDELNVYNKEYTVKKKLGKSIFGTEKYFNLIQEKNPSLITEF